MSLCSSLSYFGYSLPACEIKKRLSIWMIVKVSPALNGSGSKSLFHIKLTSYFSINEAWCFEKKKYRSKTRIFADWLSGEASLTKDAVRQLV